MIVLYVILVIAILLLAWRINHPGDMRLNRRYLARFLKDGQGRGPIRLQTSKLPIDRPKGASEERAYYNIDAEFADNSKRSVLVQIVYPLEELHKEREKRNFHGGEDASMMPGMGDLQASHNTGTHLKEDPFKDLANEEKVMAAKIAMVKKEAEHLRLLSTHSQIFPRFIAHDEQRLITITEPVGKHRLDDVWQESSDVDRQHLLTQLMQELAELHMHGHDLYAQLPPGPPHSERAMREAIYASLANGLKVDASIIQKVQASAAPLYATAKLAKGLRLANASPRGFYVDDQRTSSINWGGLRYDISALDVVELACDPALGLSAAQETSCFTVYLERLRQLAGPDFEALALTDLNRLAIYFQLVLLGHLAFFRQSPNAGSAATPWGIKHWSDNSLPQVASKLLAHLQADDGLAELASVLAPTLQQLM